VLSKYGLLQASVFSKYGLLQASVGGLIAYYWLIAGIGKEGAATLAGALKSEHVFVPGESLSKIDM